MNRREFLGGAAVLATVPWRRLLADTAQPAEPAWRTFETVTRVDVVKPDGVTRVWLPVPMSSDTDWQRGLGNTWNGNAKKMEAVRVGHFGVPMLYTEWSPGQESPFVELKSKFSTRDRTVDLTAARASAPKLTKDEIALYTAPTEYIPCDGLVRETALMRAAKGARTDLDKGRSIYEWIVQNTNRDPKAKGCGTGNVKAMLESGNLGGKCADLNGLFVGLCRSLGIPARDVYGIRVASSKLGYKSLGASSSTVTKSQHCRAEFFAEGIGWVPVDPADVRKVMLEEPPGNLPLQDSKVDAAHKRLFGSWEMNWLALNVGHDVELPNSKGPKLPFFMYPNGETGGERLDSLDPDKFKYTITASET